MWRPVHFGLLLSLNTLSWAWIKYYDHDNIIRTENISQSNTFCLIVLEIDPRDASLLSVHCAAETSRWNFSSPLGTHSPDVCVFYVFGFIQEDPSLESKFSEGNVQFDQDYSGGSWNMTESTHEEMSLMTGQKCFLSGRVCHDFFADVSISDSVFLWVFLRNATHCFTALHNRHNAHRVHGRTSWW